MPSFIDISLNTGTSKWLICNNKKKINTEFSHKTLSWSSPISPTHSDIMTSLSYGSADWFSPVSVANELTAQYSNTWLLFDVAVGQRTSETPHLPQLHLYRSAMRGFMYAIWGYSCVICSAAGFSTCSQQHVGDVLAVAILCTCSAAAAAADLSRQDQIH